MSGLTRKIHYKVVRQAAANHTGKPGDIWYDPDTTALRFYNGDAGGQSAGGDSYSSSDFIDYGAGNTAQDVAINLTKKYHWICNLNSNSYVYTLADGVDGQVLEFYASNGLLGDDKSNILVANCYYWESNDNAYRSGPRSIRIFDSQSPNTICTKVTARFLNYGWHFDAPLLDNGPF